MFVQTNTVKSIRSYFKARLSEKFSENEIKLIGNEVICSRLGLSKTEIVGINEQFLSESDLLHFRSIVKRLLNNEPFQYVVGNTFFYDLELKCDARALIPRPETEELVDWIKESFSKINPIYFADICTGSGCIGLSLKSIFPDSKIIAADFSNDALLLAKENSDALSLDLEFLQFDATIEKEYTIIDSDLEGKFDCWVSNPPYIPTLEKDLMAKNVLEFEPHIALFVSDNDPVLFYRVISKMANKYLKPKGLLFFEIHENLSIQVMEVLKNDGFANVEIRKDLQGKNRMMKAEKM